MKRIFLLLVLVFPLFSFAGLKVKYNKENVVASALAGSWRLDISITDSLGGFKDINEITFIKDENIVSKIPKKYESFLIKSQIYLSGMMKFNNKNYPFILINLSGNPHIVYFRDKNGKSMGDSESFIVMLAKGNKKNRDLLLIGGDFNNQPFSSFKRIFRKK